MFAPFAPMLAQASPPADALASWLSVLMYLIGVVAAILGAAVLVKQLRAPQDNGLPQPLEVRPARSVVTEDDLTKTHGRISRERSEVDRQIEDIIETQKLFDDKLSKSVEFLRLEIKGDIFAVQNRINDVLAAVAELRGRINGKHP